MNTDKIVGKVKELQGRVTSNQKNGDYSLQAAIGNKREELVGLAQKNYGLVKEKSQEVAEKVSDKTDAVKQTVSDQLIDYNSKLEKAADKLPGNVKKTIARYPWVTIAGASVAGLILGMWLKPRRRR